MQGSSTPILVVTSVQYSSVHIFRRWGTQGQSLPSTLPAYIPLRVLLDRLLPQHYIPWRPAELGRRLTSQTLCTTFCGCPCCLERRESCWHRRKHVQSICWKCLMENVPWSRDSVEILVTGCVVAWDCFWLLHKKDFVAIYLFCENSRIYPCAVILHS